MLALAVARDFRAPLRRLAGAGTVASRKKPDRERPSRDRVRAAFARLAEVRGGAERVTLEELRREFLDDGHRLARYLDECRRDELAALRSAAADEVETRVAAAMAERDAPSPRRRGRPSAAEKDRRLAAEQAAERSGGTAVPRPGEGGSFVRRAEERRDRLRLAPHANRRPDVEPEARDARRPARRTPRPLDARERFAEALAGRLRRGPSIALVAEADWVGATNKAIARECALHLRRVGGRLQDEPLRDHLKRHFGWDKPMTERALVVGLKGSRLRKRAGWWSFAGETKKDAEKAEDRFLERLYLEAALETIEETDGWTTIADVEDALGAKDRFPAGWLGDALYRAANGAHRRIMRSGDGRYRATAAKSVRRR
ncbi:hypothetical protein ABIE85_007133 [Bradyrhizobium diazoefficiens]